MNTTSEEMKRIEESIPDADPAKRPGIPMELSPPRPVGHAHWTVPDRQVDPGGILRRKGGALTPVFGVTIAPRGLSGVLRKAAYGIPEHYTSHWLVLLLADRVDALEARIRRPAFALPLLAIGAAGVAALALRPRRHRRRWTVG